LTFDADSINEYIKSLFIPILMDIAAFGKNIEPHNLSFYIGHTN